MTDLTVAFAHTIEPNSLESLADEVTSEEWKMKEMLINALASFPHPDGGGATFYVLFLDPSNKTLDAVVDADWLYAHYETEFYNEEIYLITPK